MDNDELMPVLNYRRRRSWRQTPDTRLVSSNDAIPFIERAGLVTQFPASSEVPNLFHAFTGDPTAATDSGHSTPSGQVYAWRWELGWRSAGFYGVIVRKRPTWVSLKLLPALLRLRGEPRRPERLYDEGLMSSGALRVANALEDAQEPLSTGELRRRSDFPTGTDQRRAFLKAIAELDSHLLLARVFLPGSTETCLELTATRFPDEVEGASRLTLTEAASTLIETYLPVAGYLRAGALAKHLGLPPALITSSADALVASGRVEPACDPVSGESLYIWSETSKPSSGSSSE